MSWTSQSRTNIVNTVTNITGYINTELSSEIDKADGFLSSYLNTKNQGQLALFETQRNNINSKLNRLKKLRKDLTEKLSNSEMRSQKQKLQEIGTLQQTNKAKTDTLHTLKNELEVAEARENAIKNRNSESSYMQTFGYIFRPFRRVSYAIIVPLIFIMICMSVYLVWTAPVSLKLNMGSSVLPAPSAPPANNFNKQLKGLFK